MLLVIFKVLMLDFTQSVETIWAYVRPKRRLKRLKFSGPEE